MNREFRRLYKAILEDGDKVRYQDERWIVLYHEANHAESFAIELDHIINIPTGICYKKGHGECAI